MNEEKICPFMSGVVPGGLIKVECIKEQCMAWVRYNGSNMTGKCRLIP